MYFPKWASSHQSWNYKGLCSCSLPISMAWKPTKCMCPFQEATEQYVSRIHKNRATWTCVRWTLQKLISLSKKHSLICYQEQFFFFFFYNPVSVKQKICSWTELRVLAFTTEPWEQMPFILEFTGFGSYAKDWTCSIAEILIKVWCVCVCACVCECVCVCCIIILFYRQNTEVYREGKFNNWCSHGSQNTSEAFPLQILCS